MIIMRIVIVAPVLSLLFLFYLVYHNLNAQSIPNSTLTNPNGTDTSTDSKIDQQSRTNSSDKLVVISSFFPIDEFVRKIGGGAVKSSVLIPVGVEPHDFEPTINQIQAVSSADVLVYNDLGLENWIQKINVINKINASKGLNASYIDERKITLRPNFFARSIISVSRVGVISASGAEPEILCWVTPYLLAKYEKEL